jgi:hypothetical protein
MQRWFLIVMLVLLPVRGWSAQLMGVQMGAMQMGAMQTGVQAHATQADPVQIDAMPMHALASPMHKAADMPADCPMHMAAQALGHHAAAGDTANTADHPTCQACQLCMPLAVLVQSPLTLGSQRCPMPLPQVRIGFVSAVLAQAVKPPIL